MNATITREDDGPAADEAAVGKALHQFNLTHTGEQPYTPVRLFVRDENGAIVGGLLAVAHMEWMFVRMLWLHERLRGGGHGTELMRRAEDAARELGCTGIWLDTFSFQAPGFTRHFFRKRLARRADP